MSRAEQHWDTLVSAVSTETDLVHRLVTVTVEMARPLSLLDIAEIERTTAVQESVLARIEQAARVREDALERCLPESSRHSSRLAFQMVISAAPERCAKELRRLRDRLLLLRDEFQLVRARNRLLMEQTLEFTAHFGRSLATPDSAPPSYDATGARSPVASRGELFSGAL